MLQIDLVLSVEEILHNLHLRHLFPRVIQDPPYSIRINKPSTLFSEWCDTMKIPKFITEFYLQWFVSDPFFMTGEELADAIKQTVSSLAHGVQVPCPVDLAIHYSISCMDRSHSLMHGKHLKLVSYQQCFNSKWLMCITIQNKLFCRLRSVLENGCNFLALFTDLSHCLPFGLCSKQYMKDSGKGREAYPQICTHSTSEQVSTVLWSRALSSRWVFEKIPSALVWSFAHHAASFLVFP